MNVFETKDGKVYQVSLQNFVGATGKKAPYYKKVKTDGRFVEKAYAICPGCKGPAHFVNLFNPDKARKPHTRHQRSTIRGLAKYSAAAYKGCPYVAKRTNKLKKGTRISDEIAAFCAAMEQAFGIGYESAGLLARIYYALLNENPSTASQRLFAIMASAWYGDTSLKDVEARKDYASAEKHAMGLPWFMVGNIKEEQAEIDYICSLGFVEIEVKNLFDEIGNQHFGQFGPSKPDLSHLSATVATILNNNLAVKAIVDTLAAADIGIGSTDANAGYIGDLCGTGPIPPSMNNGDYKADLDAVNLAERIKANPNGSLLAIVSSYYKEPTSGEINRAKEFKENIGPQTLKGQRDAFFLSMQKKLHDNDKDGFSPDINDAEKKAELEKMIALFNRFIGCIDRELDDWPEDE